MRISWLVHALNSPGQKSAVHYDRFAGRVTGGVADEVDRGAYQLRRVAETVHRRVLPQPLAPRRPFDQRAVEVRREDARRDPVHADAVLAPLVGQPAD